MTAEDLSQSPESHAQLLNTFQTAIAGVANLVSKVEQLDQHVTIAEDASDAAAEAAKRAEEAAGSSSLATKIAVIVSVLALVTTGLAFWSLHENCVTGNETRAASAGIWSVVLSANASPSASAAQKEQARIFSQYVQAVYQPHNCWNLLKSYSVPAKPDLRPAG